MLFFFGMRVIRKYHVNGNVKVIDFGALIREWIFVSSCLIIHVLILVLVRLNSIRSIIFLELHEKKASILYRGCCSFTSVPMSHPWTVADVQSQNGGKDLCKVNFYNPMKNQFYLNVHVVSKRKTSQEYKGQCIYFLFQNVFIKF